MATRTIDLFSAGQIGRLNVPNRLVRSATAERLATEHAGRVTGRLTDLYRSLAAGGVGLIVSGHAYVAPMGKAHPEMLGVFCDSLIDGLSTLAAAVHEAGGLVAMQINHAGRQRDPVLAGQPLAPSAVPIPPVHASAPAEQMAREMSHADIVATIDAFGDAARRARLAGFDAVQIHAAHGYLLSQFLSPHTNLRTDAWGGNFERRLKFLAAVCEAVRGQVGRDYPVFVKLGMIDHPERVPGGLTLADGVRIVGRLAGFGLDAVEVSSGDGRGTDLSIRRGVGTRHPEAYFRRLAQRARAATSLPLILVGGMRSRATMDDVIASGDADFVSMCRPLIREPDLPRRLLLGEATAATCNSCGRCWPGGMDEGISCKCGG